MAKTKTADKAAESNPKASDNTAEQAAKAFTTTDVPFPQKEASSRAQWTGNLSFGIVTFPVKAYTSTKLAKFAYNQLHADCKSRLSQGSMHCNTCNCDVPKESIIKGFEYTKDQYVVVDEKELEKLEPASNELTEIVEFVSASEVDPIVFESAQYLSPGKGGDKGFSLLHKALTVSGKVGVARRCERGREQYMVIRPFTHLDGQPGLAAHYMWLDNELRSFDKWTPVAVSDDEVKMAVMLIDGMSDSFDLTAYKDEYLVNVHQYLGSLVKGDSAPVVEKKSAPVANDLMAALKESLEKMANKPKAKRAKAA